MAKTRKPAAEPVAAPVEQVAPVEPAAAPVTVEQPAAAVVPADPAPEPQEEAAPDPLSRALEAAEVEDGHVRLSLEHYEALTVADLHRLCGTLTGRSFQGAAVHPATRTVTL